MAADHAGERELATEMVPEASARLTRTVDGFHGDDWGTPSLLRDWSRASVVAHLTLNAEAMARALRGVVAPPDEETPRTMYDSDDQRAEDIAELATHDPSEIRARLLGATTALQEAVAAVPDDRWETRIERTPGGRTMRAAAFPGMRWRELEIHHVDLGAGYTTADWSREFAEHLLDAMGKRVNPEHPFEVRPLDSPLTWVFGPGESEYPVPVVTGPAADIGWWLTGRPPSPTVSCSHGELPSIEGW